MDKNVILRASALRMTLWGIIAMTVYGLFITMHVAVYLNNDTYLY
ncbi:MAG TPA: hypothetical protein PLV23_07500 [Sedimentibacter sp.]|nr:hypothetical protein [Sedimentibacter sp.]